LGQLLPEEKEIRARTSIYTFEPVATLPLFAHEITHLVFNEFMEFYNPDEAEKLRWLNEGLATYEELQFYSDTEGQEMRRLTRPLVRQNAYPLKTAFEFKPFRERVVSLGSYVLAGRTHYFSNIDIWYWQARELAAFLIESKGRYNFYVLMNALKQKKSIDAAIQEAYPGDGGTWESWKMNGGKI